MKKYIYSLIGILFSSKVSAAGDPFGTSRISDGLKNGGGDLVTTADNTLYYIIGLFYFIAVVIGIYGGFLILVSGGDEEKVKKGKNYIIYMVIGLVVIFLSSIIVRWIIGLMTDTNIVGQ